MMYMPDAIRATLELMHTPAARLSVRTAYNLSAMSVTPSEVTDAINRYLPEFKAGYAPDFRQSIADTWPGSIDDSAARRDWGWDHQYELAATTKDMLLHLSLQYRQDPARSVEIAPSLKSSVFF
jgi:nucleoside-diphosphate-sugar epimerase